jgi:hypothetical protein
MDDGRWGHCRSCKFFSSPARMPLDGEEARCAQPELPGSSLRCSARTTVRDGT